MYTKSLLLHALMCAFLGLAPPARADIAYTLTDLGSLSRADSYSEAYGVNAYGQSVGISLVNIGDLVAGEVRFHAVSHQNGIMADLGTLGGSTSAANAVNASGQIAGYAYLRGDEAFHAFVTQNDGSLLDLGTLGGKLSEAHAINSAGQIVGSSNLPGDDVEHAFLYQYGAMTDLGTLGGGGSEAFGINDAGHVVGSAWLPDDSAQHAFVSRNGVMVDLTPYANWGEARGINAAGQVAGTFEIDGHEHAFLAQPDGTLSDLGALAGGSFTHGNAINVYGQIVGDSTGRFHDVDHAFVTQHGRLVDLNDLIDASTGWTLNSANAINDNGQIVGAGYTAGGAYHAYLLTPVYTDPPSVSIQPRAFNVTATAPANVSVTASVSIAGGQAPLKTAWRVEGDFSLSGAANPSTAVSAWVQAGQTLRGTLSVKVTDARGRTAQASAPISITGLMKRNPHVLDPGVEPPDDSGL